MRVLIKIPIEIDSSTRKLIKESYLSAINEIGIDEYEYVDKKIAIVTKRLQSSTEEWKSSLGDYAVALHNVYRKYLQHSAPVCSHKFDPSDDNCLDCGESDDSSDMYEICHENASKLLELERKICKKGNLPEVRCAILAALFYICNPYDVIPDHTPGKGYIDDAFVINMCFDIIQKKCPNLAENIITN